MQREWDLGFPPAGSRLVDSACDRYEAELKSGRHPSIEECLCQVPEDERDALVRELVLLDVHYRCVSGQTPTSDEYVRRFPSLDAGWLAGMIASAAPASSPRRLGRFELLERCGRGGFGTVWKARDADLDRVVAVKLLNPGSEATLADLERFRREARAAARLRHPGIATVHEACVAEGQPLLVQEHVEGVSLAELCSSRRLSFEQAARLVASIADALDYAHEMGVVHRDVKPGNVIVHEPTLRPVLVDFGLARRSDAAGLTADGAVLGTPVYMSPEQAGGHAAAADRRSDVYALGAVLYELSTGEPPFRGAASDVLRQVAAGAMRRPCAVDRSVPKDLETIILKAVATSPSDRYATARALADDLRRFLDGEAVEARRHSAWYVLRKSLLKHRVAVGIASAFVAVLLGASAAVGALAVRVREEAQTSARVSSFLEGLLRASDPEQARGEDPRASRLLARGAARLDEALGDQPLVKARMASVIGDVYLSMGRSRDAAPLLEEALAVREERLGPSHPDIADTLEELARADLGRERFDEAEARARRALEIRQQRFGAGSEAAARSLHQLAEIAAARGDLAEAERLFWSALAIDETVHGAVSVEVAQDMAGIASVASRRRDLARASRLSSRAVLVAERAVGEEAPALVRLLLQRSDVLRQSGRLGEARADCERAVALARRIYGDDHPVVARALLQGAILADPGYLRDRALTLPSGPAPGPPNGMPDDAGRHDEIEARMREVLAMTERLEGPSSTGVAVTCQYLAGFLRHLGRDDEATALLQRSIDAFVAVHGPQDEEVAEATLELARHHAAAGRIADAQEAFARSLEIRQALGPAGSVTLARVRIELAGFFMATGRREQALRVAREALAPWESEGPPRSGMAGEAATALGEAFRMLGAPRESRRCYEMAVELCETWQGKGSRAAAQAWNGLCAGHRYTGCPDAAVQDCENAIAASIASQGPYSPDALTTRMNLARALLDAGRPEEAQRAVESLQPLFRSFGEPGATMLAQVEATLAEALCRTGAADEGAALVRGVQEVQHAHPAGSPAYMLLLSGTCRLAQGRAAEAEPDLRRAVELVDAMDVTSSSIQMRAKAREALADCLTALGPGGDAEASALREAARAIRESVAMPCP